MRSSKIFSTVILFFLMGFTADLLSQIGPGGVGNTVNSQLWLRADRGVLPFGLNQVVNWQDQSGKGRHFSLVEVGQDVPVLVSNFINGRPAIQFNAHGGVNGQFLGFDGSLGISGSGATTVILVARNTTAVNEQNGGLFMGQKGVGTNNEVRDYGIEYASAVRWATNRAQVYNNGHTLNNWKIIVYHNQAGATGNQYLASLNGTNLGLQNNIPQVYLLNNDFALLGATQFGGTYNSAGYLDGEIAEVMVLSSQLNAAERTVVENSLAAKYNIGISNDYYAYESTHSYDVAGIAGVAGTTFTTPWSGSMIGLSAPTGLANGEYLFYGHDNGAVNAWTTTEVPVTGMQRLTREWRFDETGDVGTVTISIPRSSLPLLPVGYSTAGILVDADGDFTSGATYYEMTEAAGVFSKNLNIASGQYVAIVIYRPEITFTVASGYGPESIGTVNIEVSMGLVLGSNVTVDYAATGGTASNGSDFNLPAGTLTILAGDLTGNIPLPVTDDAVAEPSETVILTLTNPSTGVITGGTYTYTINDNDNAYLAQFTTSTGSGLENVTPVTIPVVLNAANATLGLLTVDYKVTGGTAGRGTDFILADGTLIYNIGDNTANIVVPITDDAYYEADETFVITLTGTSGPEIGIGVNGVFTYTILNNDILPQIAFSSASSSGGESFQQVDVGLTLQQVVGVDVSVTYTVQAGTATAGTDFVAATGQVTIPAGLTNGNVRFTVIDDVLAESNETVRILLSAPVNASLGAIDQHTYTILDDDALGWLLPAGITNATQNKVWYNSVLTFLADGSKVSSWPDLTGNSNPAFQATPALQPVFRANLWNGRPVVEFNGTNLLKIADDPDINTGGPYDKKTLIVAFRTSTDITTRQVLYEEGGSTRGLNIYILNGNIYVSGWNKANDDGLLTTPWPTVGNTISVFQAINTNTPYIVGMEFNFNAATGTGAVTGYLNGNSIGVLSGAGRLFAHSDDIGLGGMNQNTYFHDMPGAGDGYYFNGLMGEFINSLYVYNSAQKIILNNYLSSKWLIPITNDRYAYDLSYGWELFGIGREDVNNIQPVSQGSGIIRIENPSSLGDGEYLLSGHDNGALTWTATGVPDGDVNFRILNRKWRADETTAGDGVGTIRLSVDATRIASSPVGFTKYVVLTDDDGDFSSGAMASEMQYNVSTSMWYADNVILSGDKFYTIGVVKPAIEFVVPSGFGPESIGTINIQVKLNFIPSSNVTADITASGTATSGTDYSFGVAQVLIPAGSSNTVVPVSIFDDALPESDETIILTLSNPSTDVTLGTNSVYTYTINDNDGLRKIQFNVTSDSKAESVGSYNILVSLDIADPANPTTVNYAVTGGTATPGSDFTLPAGTLTIPAGATTGTIPVTVIDDAVKENNETVVVQLSNPANADLGVNTQFTFTITDNEPAINISFLSAASSGVESISPVELPIFLSGVSGVPITVYYSAIGGTADNIYAGAYDYILFNGSSRVIPAGRTMDSLNLIVFNDKILEPDETIIIRIDSIHGGIASGITQTTYTIFDDDNAGYIGPGGYGNETDYLTWLKADFQSYGNGTAVGTFDDASLNNRDATQNGGSRPTYYSTTNPVYGRPYLNFDGANDYMTMSTTGIDDNINYTEKTVNLALRTGSDVTSLQFLYFQGGTTRNISIYLNGGRIYLGAASLSTWGAGYKSVSTPVAVSTVYFVRLEIQYNSVLGTGEIRGYINGSLIGSLAITGPYNGGQAGAVVRLGTGLNNAVYNGGTAGSGSSNYYKGDMMELLLYNKVPNTPQRILVSNYLGAKYGVTPAQDFYNYEVNNSYEVFGLGRESSESHLISQGSGFVKFDQPTIINNGNYLLAGHNNGTIATWSNTTPDTYAQYFNRTWRVSEAGNFGGIRVYVDTLAIPAKSGLFKTYILIVDGDGDGNFNTGTLKYYGLRQRDGSFAYTTGVDLKSGDAFTFGIGQNVSAKTGNWSDPTSWTINVPQPSEAAIILNTHTITLDVNAQVDNLTINAGGGINLTDKQIGISGALTTSGTFTAGTGTTIFNGTIAQNIPALTYYNLTVANSGAKTLAGNITVGGTLSILDATSVLNGSNRQINLAGNWTSRGTFNYQTSTLVLNGSGVQQIFHQTAASESFYNLTVSAGTGVTSNVNVSSAGTLTMNGNDFNLGGKVLQVGVNAANPGTFTYTSGNIIGTFGRWIRTAQNNQDLLFPIATGGFSRHFTYNFNTISSAGVIYVGFIATPPTTSGLPLSEGGYTINQLFTEGYWDTYKDGLFAFTGNFNITMVPGGFSSYGIDANTRVVGRFLASDWFLPGTHAAGSPAKLFRDGLNQFVFNYAAGTSQTCTAVFQNCPADIVRNAAAGACSAIVSWTAPNLSNPCAGLTVTSNYSPGATFNVGSTLVKYYLNNGPVKIDSCKFVVTVNDTQNPLIVCPGNRTRNTDATGCYYTVIGTEFNPVLASDNCSYTLVNDFNGLATLAGAQFPNGTTTVKWFISDPSGNNTNCSFDVTVNDLIVPVLTPVANRNENVNAACNFTIPDYTSLTSATDNCTVSPAVTQLPVVGTGLNGAGTTQLITLRATDGSGNFATTTFVITLVDVTPPVANCKNITVVLDATGNASITAADINNGSNDNCGINSLSIDKSSFTCADLGIVPVTLTVTDNSGNTSICVSNVTVTTSLNINNVTLQSCDAIPGIAALFEANVTGGDGNYTYFWDGLDDSVDPFMTITLFPFSLTTSNTSTEETPLLNWFLPNGPQSVQLTVTDGNGCTDTFILNFTKNGLTTDNISVNLSDACEGEVKIYSAGYDIDATYAWEVENGTILSAITDSSRIEVQWDLGVTAGVVKTNITQPSLFGDCGSSVIDSVTVHPTPVPSLVASDVSVCLGSSHTYILSNTYSIYNWTITGGSITGGGGGFNFATVLWTSSGTGNVAVEVISAAGCSNTTDVDVEVYQVTGTIDSQINESCAGYADGEVTVSGSGGFGTHHVSIDGGTTFFNSPHTFTGLTAGAYTVIVNDDLTCSYNLPVNIIVDDIIPPVAICKDITVQLDASGNATIVVADVNNGSTDNCGIASMTIDNNMFDCSDIGPNNVTLTVTDVNSNVSSCVAIVTVQDNMDPVTPVLANVTGECSATAVVPTTTDNCAGVVTGTTGDPLTYNAQGTYTINWTFDDGNGNSIIVPQTVIVDDVTPPVPTIPVLADVTAECSVAALTAPTATDNCGGAVTVTNNATLPITTQGTTVVTWTYDDGHGNTSTQNQNVVIDDVTAPVPTLPVLADVTAECSVAALTAPTATDNCGGAVTVTNNATLPITTQGTTVVTWTYDDGHGNTSTQNQNVVITDVTAPVPSLPVLPDVTDECSIAALTPPTATDNCGGVVTVTNNAILPITTQGTTVVTWTYTDVNGNSSTQTQNVVIDDVTGPIPDAPVLPDVTDECSVAALTAPTATDNCGGVVTVTNNATLPIITQGTTVVTWTYDDVNGNTTTQNQNVVITDVTAPVPSLPVLPDVTDECSVAALVAPTATDNCGGIVTVTNNATLPITIQGTTVVTWTYDDGNGNTSTQNQNVVITDVTAPVPDVPVLPDVTDECSIVALTAPTATDNCGGVVTVTNNATLPITAQGTTVVTWTYDDGNGNTSTQNQNVVITDITAPSIVCPSDISQNEDAGFTYATVIVPDAVIADNCVVSDLTWSMAGATTAASPAGGINQIGTYIFNTGNTTVTYIVSDAGSNTNTCSFTVTVTVPAVLSGSIVSQIDVLCNGDNTGSVTVTGIDGTPPYEYSIDGGASYQPSGTFSSLTAGPYTVTVRDFALSTFDIPVTIAQPALPLTVTATQVNVLCNGNSTGSASASGAGGTLPYSYSWNTTPVQTAADAAGLAAGTYIVTVTDANGCTANTSVTITEPPVLTVTMSQTNVQCYGGSDGTATATPSGGAGLYSYSWDTSPVQNSATATGLTAGTYNVTVTDGNGCTKAGNVTITEPTALELNMVPSDADCPESNEGSITLTVTGGTSPYSYIWKDNGSTAQNRTSLIPGRYVVAVTDANGCSTKDSTDVGYTGSYKCLVIPQIITPGKIDGHNDEWVITNIDLYPNAEVKVYTRWGKLIFSTKNIAANPWDGKFKGKLMPTDSYHYILYLNDGSEPRSGVISIIR